jgi:hypothetical protein
MDNFSIVRTIRGKEVLIYNENLNRVFNMRKTTLVSQCDYLGNILTEDQEPRWVEMSNDCDTKYAFKGETKVEKKNLLSILYGRIENNQKELEKYQRAMRRKELHGGKRRNNDSRKRPGGRT